MVAGIATPSSSTPRRAFRLHHQLHIGGELVEEHKVVSLELADGTKVK